LFVPKFLLGDEGQYNRLRQQAAEEVYLVPEGQIIQPPTTTVGQIESEGSISVLYILTANITH
jgi:hypothetical protein